MTGGLFAKIKQYLKSNLKIKYICSGVDIILKMEAMSQADAPDRSIVTISYKISAIYYFCTS